MTAAEFAASLETLGWSGRHLAARLGCHRNLTTEWAAGRVPVPDAVARWLRQLVAALHDLPPPAWRTVSAA